MPQEMRSGRPLPRMLPPAWRRRPLLVVALLLLLLLAVLDHAGRLGSRGDDRTRYHDRVFRVVEVIDGDTFDIDAPDAGRPHTRVRLWGVDSPELHRPGHGPMHFGREACDFAQRSLLGRRVRIILGPGRTRDNDRYNRLLAYAYLVDVEPGRGARPRSDPWDQTPGPDGPMFNEMLISTGHAYADPRFDHPWAERFADLEERARRDRLGLWREVRPEQFPPWKQRMEQSRVGGCGRP